MDKYFIANHHQAIISHEDFEAVARAISQRGNQYQKRYPFSSYITCSECGGTFKRRIHYREQRQYIAWSCTTHIKDIKRCSMKSIKDEDIKLAFIRMINKLIFAKNLILRPLQVGIRLMRKSENLSQMDELESKIEDNLSQEKLLVRLMAKGYLKPALFNKEKNHLLMVRKKLNMKKESLVSELDSDLSRGREVNNFIKLLKELSFLKEFAEEIFHDHVERIEVFTRNQIGFVLKCGITLKERI